MSERKTMIVQKLAASNLFLALVIYITIIPVNGLCGEEKCQTNYYCDTIMTKCRPCSMLCHEKPELSKQGCKENCPGYYSKDSPNMDSTVDSSNVGSWKMVVAFIVGVIMSLAIIIAGSFGCLVFALKHRRAMVQLHSMNNFKEQQADSYYNRNGYTPILKRMEMNQDDRSPRITHQNEMTPFHSQVHVYSSQCSSTPPKGNTHAETGYQYQLQSNRNKWKNSADEYYNAVDNAYSPIIKGTERNQSDTSPRLTHQIEISPSYSVPEEAASVIETGDHQVQGRNIPDDITSDHGIVTEDDINGSCSQETGDITSALVHAGQLENDFEDSGVHMEEDESPHSFDIQDHQTTMKTPVQVASVTEISVCDSEDNGFAEIEFTDDISPQQFYDNFKNKIQEYGMPDYVNNHDLHAGKIQFEVDEGKTDELKEYLTTLYAGNYDRKMITIKENPWLWSGKEDGESPGRFAVLEEIERICHGQQKTTFGPGSLILLLLSNIAKHVRLDGKIKTLGDLCRKFKHKDLNVDDLTYGTVGGFVKDKDLKVYGVTSQHVITRKKHGFLSDHEEEKDKGASASVDRTVMSQRKVNSNADSGPVILEIGMSKAGILCDNSSYSTENNDAIANLSDSYILYDIALIEMENVENLLSEEYFQPLLWEDGNDGNYIKPVPQKTDLAQGTEVQKIGAKTGHTKGIIYDTNLNWPWTKDDTDKHLKCLGSFAVKHVPVPGEKKSFAELGDSGSWVTCMSTGEREILGIVHKVNEWGKALCVNFTYNFNELARQVKEIYNIELELLQPEDIQSIKQKYEGPSKTSTNLEESEVESLVDVVT